MSERLTAIPVEVGRDGAATARTGAEPVEVLRQSVVGVNRFTSVQAEAMRAGTTAARCTQFPGVEILRANDEPSPTTGQPFLLKWQNRHNRNLIRR